MRYRARMRIASLVLLIAAAAVGACSSKDSGQTCTAYSPPSGTDLQNPKVSFKNDVLPIFQNSCAFSDCHADRNDPRRAFLGEPKTAGLPTDPTEVHSGIVNKAPQDLPTMSYVTPGDPQNSFLMHKMNGDQCLFDSKCKGGTCGNSMPDNNPILSESTRLVVYRWITQGAPNN